MSLEASRAVEMAWDVPLCDLRLGEPEVEAVVQVLRSNWISMGEVTEAFESEFAGLVGSKCAVAVASGTAALHLALLALEIGPGDEVICPSLTFVATANAVRYTGARPVFADVISTEDLTIAPSEIERRITPRTRAILVMHYAGYACCMEEILKISERHGLAVVEDAAHAPLAEYQGMKLGTLGRLGCFSFFSNKNLTTAEGGMIVTDDGELAARLRRLRSHGMTTRSYDRFRGHAHSYDVVELGFNYRLDDIRAALGLAQLRQLAGWNRRRREITTVFREAFQELPGLTIPFRGFARGESGAHLFPVILPGPEHRQALIGFLRRRRIQTSIHYPAVHEFSIYRQIWPDLRLPVTERVAACEVTLPLFPAMTGAQVQCVLDGIRDAWQAAGG